MKIYTYQPQSNARGGGREIPPLAPGVSSARFGEEVLLYSDEPQEQKSPAGASRGARMPRRHEDVTKDRMHVVVQNGRLFQQHHPDVPVIHDRGRFLLVNLDQEQARKLSDENETCFGIFPLEDNQVVFDSRAPVAGRAPVEFIQKLINKISRESIETNLTKLVSFGTRHSTSAGFGNAATFAQKQLKDLSYQTRSQVVTVGAGKSKNIIADKPGAGTGKRDVVIASAHLDSINLQGGPSAPAPGADDNGSGSAGLLEIARVFQGHRGKHDLRLILFGGEEQGLFGSKRYVASLTQSERKRIRAVVNMDMIGSLNSASRSVLLEGAPLSQKVIDGLAQAAATYTQLPVETSLNPFASDHVPFINAQIPAVLTIEGADNANNSIHSANDTLNKIDFEIAQEILRMNIAFIASEIGRVA
ncbi:MAG TPA: M28 family metallopeptidase [Blastocatellia bacterium]|nr:M28 family metallopeptidase [Blastocatellia bacterium]